MKRWIREGFQTVTKLLDGPASNYVNITFSQEVTPEQAVTVSSFEQPTRTLWLDGRSLAYSLTFTHDMLMYTDKARCENARAASRSAGWPTEVLYASQLCASLRWQDVVFNWILAHVYTGILEEWNMLNNVCEVEGPACMQDMCGREFDRQAAVLSR